MQNSNNFESNFFTDIKKLNFFNNRLMTMNFYTLSEVKDDKWNGYFYTYHPVLCCVCNEPTGAFVCVWFGINFMRFAGGSVACDDHALNKTQIFDK